MQRGTRVAALSVAIVGMLAFGCARPMPERADPVDDALIRAAQGIQRDLGFLVELQQVHKPFPGLAGKGRAPLEIPDPRLQEPVTLSWAGPIEPVVEALAKLSGYRYRVVGKAPVNPRLITLHVRSQPMVKVIEHIGWQAGEKIGLVLNPGLKELRLVYVGE